MPVFVVPADSEISISAARTMPHTVNLLRWFVITESESKGLETREAPSRKEARPQVVLKRSGRVQ